jgi:succinate dehydrogenase flavin-adding protein (antitoxin of CptAB toxin-antitoxin module)|tara:strand:+ start:78 stop:278 length:201 start_codon:yes stop_codon:yes gene_type:complete
MLELDLILNKFCDYKIMNLSDENKRLFLELLNMDDKDIWHILDPNVDSKYDSLIKLVSQDNNKVFT